MPIPQESTISCEKITSVGSLQRYVGEDLLTRIYRAAESLAELLVQEK